MSERRTAYLLLFAMAVCFGGTWPAGKLAVEAVTPFTVAATRFTLATLLLAVWAARRGGFVRPTRRDLPLVLALGATAVAGYNALFLYGLELAPARTARSSSRAWRRSFRCSSRGRFSASGSADAGWRVSCSRSRASPL